MGYRIDQEKGYLEFLVGIINYCKRDFDLEYDEMLTLALEVGMTPNEFWENDINLFYAYQKSYINRTYKKAHIQGAYNNIAFGIVLANAFKDKNSKNIDYPKEDVLNPFNKENKEIANSNTNAISKIDTSKNNNGLYQIKKILEERRNKK